MNAMNENLLGQQVPIAIITAYVIEWLKGKPWFPFANIDTAWANRITAALCAFGAAIAIHVTFNSADGTLLVTGLHARMILHGLWAGVQQYALQHFIYKTGIEAKKVVNVGPGNITSKFPTTR